MTSKNAYLEVKTRKLFLLANKMYISRQGGGGFNPSPKRKTTKAFLDKMKFLLTYVVGILGISFFNLGTAWIACVIEAPMRL